MCNVSVLEPVLLQLLADPTSRSNVVGIVVDPQGKKSVGIMVKPSGMMKCGDRGRTLGCDVVQPSP